MLVQVEIERLLTKLPYFGLDIPHLTGGYLRIVPRKQVILFERSDKSRSVG